MYDFDKLKSNFLRIIGINAKVEESTNYAELDTALDTVPSFSEQISGLEVANETAIKLVKTEMSEQFSKVIGELEISLSGVLSSQNQKIDQIAKTISGLKVKEAVPPPKAGQVPVVEKTEPEDNKGKSADYDMVMAAVNCVPITNKLK